MLEEAEPLPPAGLREAVLDTEAQAELLAVPAAALAVPPPPPPPPPPARLPELLAEADR